MPRKILIVDDNGINRTMLCSMLRGDYDILEAENGKEALAVLHKSYKFLSAVLLDLVMPVMDGYEVLKQMHANPSLAQIPVIVTTGNTDGDTEIKALGLGANDFITKPYVPDVIKHRLKNTIKLRETAATVNAMQRDRLTGLYNREAFFQYAEELIQAHSPGYYVMACFDIDGFKIINDRYGSEKGDIVLKQVADIFRNGFEKVGGLVGRITADIFAVLYPVSFMDSEELQKIRERASVLDGTLPPISFSIGRYIAEDILLSASAMYDRAALAEETVKGRFSEKIAYYDETMRERLLYEQEIVNDMKQALPDRKFEVWFQPQYNHSSGALIGAEALVRWRHSEKGLIPPGIFIPIFERNGFVYELDKYVWEQTCAILREWLDKGISPLPVSVNISRYDIFRNDLIDFITNLVKKYDIPAELLRLEVTESVFSKSTDRIISVVKDLIDNGFTVEIDDFGSGYSSLNTLKDIPAQIVKLDMRFLEGSDNFGRGGNILESVVRMTKWLGMAVIAEGVETIEQADYLKSIGCNYVQGYLYAKPMPRKEYEKLIKGVGKEEKLLMLETVENLDNNAFWDPNSMDTLIFNTYVGGACIFEWHNDKIEILRANEKYAKTLGGENCTVEDALNLNWEEHMDADTARATRDAIEETIKTGDDATYDATYYNLFGSGKETYLRTTFRVIARTTGRYLLYATNENLTAQHEIELEKNKAAEQLRAIMDNIRGGVTAVVVKDGVPDILFANEQFYAMLGYTKEEFNREIDNPHILTHPDDRERVAKETEEISQTGKPASIVYRVLPRDGSVRWWQSDITLINLPDMNMPVQLAVANDVTDIREAQQRERETSERMRVIMDNANIGITAIILKGSEIEYLFANDRYYELLGYTKEQYDAEVENIFMLIHPDDRDRVFESVQNTNTPGETVTLEYRVTRRDKTEIWQRAIISTRIIEGVDYPVQFSVISEITAEKLAEQKIYAMNENLQNLMNDMPGAFARLQVMPDGFLATEYVNKNMCSLRGMTYEEIIASDSNDAMSTVHPDDRELVHNTLEELISTGETRNIQYRLKHSSNTFIPVNAFGRISKNSTGEIYINAYYTDLSKPEQQDLNLRETIPHLLSAIMKYSTDLVFAKDKDFRYICCSPAFVKFTRQKTESDVIGKTDYDFWTKEEADHFRSDDVELFEKGEALVDYTEPIPSDDGIQHYCRTSKYILRDGAGEIIGMYGIGRDITEEHATYEQLKLLTNNIPGGMTAATVIDGKTNYIFINNAYYTMFGYTKEQFESELENGLESLIYPDDLKKIQEDEAKKDKNSGTRRYEFRIKKRDGSMMWIRRIISVCELDGIDAPVHIAVLIDISKEREIADHLRMSEEQFRIAATIGERRTARYDIQNKIYYHDDAVLFSLGFKSAVENVPQAFIDSGHIMPECIPAYLEFYDKLQSGEKHCSADVALSLPDGSYQWTRGDAVVIFDGNDEPSQAIIVFSDITEQREKEAVYIKWQQSLEQRPENTYTLFRCNISKNSSFDSMEGSLLNIDFNAKNNTFNERTKEYVKQCVAPEDRDKYTAFMDSDGLLASYYRGNRMQTLEYRESRPNGEPVWRQLTVELVEYPNSSDVEAYLMYEDIDSEKKEELRNIERAETDPLTGILNRAAFANTVEKMIAEAGASETLALLMLDLDGFKLINDTFGHIMGDQVLKDIAVSLQSILRPGDALGRLGGDEFLVCLKNMPDDKAIQKKASRICSLLHKALNLEVFISASIGIAVYPRDGDDFETLYRKTDTALYAVKDNGKNNFAFFNESMVGEHIQPDDIEAGGDIITLIKKKKKRRILIVDDSKLSLTMLSKMFENDFIIETAENGNEALDAMRRYGAGIACVLLDLIMPCMDGFAVLEKMRASVELQSIPVIVVSGMDEHETGLRTIKCGAADFVTKPINQDLLRLRVQSAVSRAENDRLRAQNSILLMHNTETAKYRTALEGAAATVIEYEPSSGLFLYDESISKYIDGEFNDRAFTDILLSADAVTDEDAASITKLIEDAESGKECTGCSITVSLKTPVKERHLFRISAKKRVNKSGFPDRIVLTLIDIGTAE